MSPLPSKIKDQSSKIKNGRPALSTAVRKRVKRLMWERVGIIRDRDSLRRALQEFDQIAAGNISTSSANFVTLAKLVATAALWREESRGAHFRTDFPNLLKIGGFTRFNH
jgi:L-aspartate oxidase